MGNKKYFVYLGYSGFPYGLAEVKKMTLISKSLVLQGQSVNIICANGVHNQSNYPDLKPTGNFEGIHYIYTSDDPFRRDSFIKRNFLKIKGKFYELLVLREMNKTKKWNYAILLTHNFGYFFLLFCFIEIIWI